MFNIGDRLIYSDEYVFTMVGYVFYEGSLYYVGMADNGEECEHHHGDCHPWYKGFVASRDEDDDYYLDEEAA